MILVDTNVLLDIVVPEQPHFSWSQQQLANALSSGGAGVTDVIYAELSAGYRSMSDLDAVLTTIGVGHIAYTRRALFLAGRAFQRYRTGGGPRTSILPDFFIGALAEAEGLALLTRDARPYRSHFPSVRLITP